MTDSDKVLENLRLENEEREEEELKLLEMERKKTRPKSTRSSTQRMKQAKSNTRIKSEKLIKHSASGKLIVQKGNNPNTSSSAEFLKARFSARRIGGPEYSLHGKHPSMRHSLTKSDSVSSNSSNNVKPMAISFSGSNKLGGPKPVDLGGHRSSKSELSRERSKSSLTSSNLDNFRAKAGNEIIIRYGEILKKGVVDPSWKKRFFVLTDKHVYYYLNTFEVPQAIQQIDVLPKGQIPLTLIEDVKKEKGEDTKFTIFTATRTYRLQMETKRGADAWVAAIYGACENIKQQQHVKDGLNPFNGRRDSFNSIKADELDLSMNSLSMKSFRFKDPMIQMKEESYLVNKARKGVKVFEPANIEDFAHWSCFDVAAWLYTIELGHYSEMFYQNQIDGEKLKGLVKKEQCIELGMDSEEDVMTLLNAIELLKSKYDEGDVELDEE